MEPAAVATYNKYRAMCEYVRTLPLKDKRKIFALISNKNAETLNSDEVRQRPNVSKSDITTNTFLPHYAITTGEFAMWTTITTIASTSASTL